jgi:hypothetical protein
VSARDRRERFARAVARGRAARDAGVDYSANPHEAPSLPGDPPGYGLTAAAICHDAWAHGWIERDGELREIGKREAAVEEQAETEARERAP